MKRLILLLSLLFFPLSAACQTPQKPPPQVWLDLGRGEPAQALRWAKELDTYSLELGALYRLIWLELFPRLGPSQRFYSETELAWAWNAEIWKDELQFFSTLQNKLDENQTSSFSKLPNNILSQILEPFFSKSKTLSPSFLDLLKRYASYRYMKQEPLSIPLEWLGESCDWRALHFLHEKTKSRLQAETISHTCPLPTPEASIRNSSLWFFFLIAQGDAQLADGEFVAARKSYLTAETFFLESTRLKKTKVPEPLPFALVYRLVIAAGITENEVFSFFNQASRFLEQTNPLGKANPPLDSIYRSSVQNMICYRLGNLPPSEAVELLKVHFKNRPQWITQAMNQTLRGCDPIDVFSLFKAFLEQSTLPRERTEILTYLMISSIKTGKLSEVHFYAQKIIEQSKRYTSFIRSRFWKTIAYGTKSISIENTKKLVEIYQQLGFWNSSDQLYYKRILKEKKKEGSIDFQETHTSLKLPVSLELPDLPIQLDIQGYFVYTLFHSHSFAEILK